MSIQEFAGIAAVIVAGGAVASVQIMQQTIRTLKDNNQALDEQIKILKSETAKCAADHLTSQGQIAELKAQLADFRDLPLKDIQDTQAEILVTQKQIVELLTSIKGNTK